MEMLYRLRRRIIAVLVPAGLLLTPIRALAQRTLTVDIGTRADIDGIVANAANFLLISIEFLATTLFVVGALLFTVSRGKEEGLASAGTGKSLMINSLIGLAVVLSAHAILRVVLSFMYS